MTSHDTEGVATINRTLPGPAAYMCGLTWDGRYLWHSDQDAGKIFAIDPADGAVAREFDCAQVRADLAFDGAALCQVGGRPKRIVLVDPGTGEVIGDKQVLPASGRLTGIEMGPEGIWMVLREPTVVQLRDYATMTVQRELPVWGNSPSGLTHTGDVVVYGDFEESLLRAVHPQTGELLGTVAVPGHPTGLTWDGEQIWYCDFPARSFRSLDLAALLA
jgi:hypothetical protein